MLDDCFQVSQRLTSDPTTTQQQYHREIDNAADRADQRSARLVRSWLQECTKTLLGEETKEKDTTSLRLCNIKLDCASRLRGIDTAQRHANLLCIVPKTPTETSREKRRHTYRDTQSHVFSRFPPLSTRQQRYQGHESFRGIQKKTYRDQERRVFSSKLPTTCNVRCTQARRENNVQQRRRKTWSA